MTTERSAYQFADNLTIRERVLLDITCALLAGSPSLSTDVNEAQHLAERHAAAVLAAMGRTE